MHDKHHACQVWSQYFEAIELQKKAHLQYFTVNHVQF